MWLEGKAIYSLVTKKEMEIVTCCQVSRSVLVSNLQISCQYDKKVNSKAILIEKIEGKILPYVICIYSPCPKYVPISPVSTIMVCPVIR